MPFRLIECDLIRTIKENRTNVILLWHERNSFNIPHGTVIKLYQTNTSNL